MISNLNIKLKSLELKNPVILASGTFDRTITKHINPNKLGGIITKTVTLKPRQGNPLPHIIKTKHGWLNSVGLKNPGVKKFLAEDLPFWQKFQTVIIPSIGGESIKEYISLAKIFNTESIEAIEVNISCPNIKNGLAFGTDPQSVKKLVQNIRRHFNKNLIIKLTPNVTDIVAIAKAALDAGGDILSLSNTFLGMEIDNKKKKAKLARIVGGYSGPAIKPLSLRIVWQIYASLHCPIIGSGGISNFNDALDFIMAGANAIAVGSTNYQDPQVSIKIVDALEKYMAKNKIKNINNIRGII